MKLASLDRVSELRDALASQQEVLEVVEEFQGDTVPVTARVPCDLGQVVRVPLPPVLRETVIQAVRAQVAAVVEELRSLGVEVDPEPASDTPSSDAPSSSDSGSCSSGSD